MPANINSKKTWHPSRYETQEKIKRFRVISREERMRILMQENEEDVEYLDCIQYWSSRNC